MDKINIFLHSTNYYFTFMKKILLCCTAAFLFSNSALAQTKTDSVSTPTKIRVYSPTVNAEKKDNSYKWVVKTDVLKYLAGEFAVIGEYRFAKKLSAELSVGATYGFNTVNLFLEDFDDSENSKPALGGAYRGALKFYPSSDYDALEGWSFGVQVFTKTNNRDYTAEQSDDFSRSLEGKSSNLKKTGLALLITKQAFQDSNIAFEWTLGLGFVNATRNYHTADYNFETEMYSVKEFNTKESIPDLQLGFRIGFGN